MLQNEDKLNLVEKHAQCYSLVKAYMQKNNYGAALNELVSVYVLQKKIFPNNKNAITSIEQEIIDTFNLFNQKFAVPDSLSVNFKRNLLKAHRFNIFCNRIIQHQISITLPGLKNSFEKLFNFYNLILKSTYDIRMLTLLNQRLLDYSYVLQLFAERQKNLKQKQFCYILQYKVAELLSYYTSQLADFGVIEQASKSQVYTNQLLKTLEMYFKTQEEFFSANERISPWQATRFFFGYANCLSKSTKVNELEHAKALYKKLQEGKNASYQAKLDKRIEKINQSISIFASKVSVQQAGLLAKPELSNNKASFSKR